MRILLTTDTVGGVWTFTKELSAELLRIGHTVFLASFGRIPSIDQQMWCTALGQQHTRRFSYESFDVPLEWMGGNESAYEAAAPRLQEIARSFAPDLLHTNQFCFGALPLSVPKLVTAHSDVFSWAKACQANELTSSSWLISYEALVQTGLVESDCVVAPTQWMLDALKNHFQIPTNQQVIFNGRDLCQKGRTNARTMRAVSVGRLWDKSKNIRMLSQVQTPYPILVAGEIRYEDEQALLGMNNVTWLGSLSEVELVALFRTSDIYLVTSAYEPFGLAPLEAALCGCAVLANDLESLREVWGSAALYFRDADVLSDLLMHLYASPKKLREAQIRSQRRAKQLTRARMTAKYCALYAELLGCTPEYRESVDSYAS